MRLVFLFKFSYNVGLDSRMISKYNAFVISADRGWLARAQIPPRK